MNLFKIPIHIPLHFTKDGKDMEFMYEFGMSSS